MLNVSTMAMDIKMICIVFQLSGSDILFSLNSSLQLVFQVMLVQDQSILSQHVIRRTTIWLKVHLKVDFTSMWVQKVKPFKVC